MQDPKLKAQIRDFLAKCGITHDDFFIKCSLLMNLLAEENNKYNLTSIKTENEFWVKHICDSASIFLKHRNIFTPNANICDIGSGAGFPALIIALASESKVYVIESSRKKTIFIEKASSILSLQNIRIINSRAEEVNKKEQYKSFFDLITARAVASAELIFSKTRNMLAKNGKYILYKTPFSADNEIIHAKNKFNDILCSVEQSFELPLNMGQRAFITASIKNNTYD